MMLLGSLWERYFHLLLCLKAARGGSSKTSSVSQAGGIKTHTQMQSAHFQGCHYCQTLRCLNDYKIKIYRELAEGMELSQCGWNAFFSLHFPSELLCQEVRDIKGRGGKQKVRASCPVIWFVT